MRIDSFAQVDQAQQPAPPQYADDGDEWERGLEQTYSTLGFDHIEVGTIEDELF